MTIFPEILPSPAISGYGYQEEDQNLLRTSMTSGYSKVRALNSVSFNYFSVNWILDLENLSIFEAWYEYKINNGTEWFDLTLKTGTGNNVHSVRFIGRPKIKEISGNWGVSGTVETMSKNLMTEIQLDSLSSGPYSADFPAELPSPAISGYGYQEEDQNLLISSGSGFKKVRHLNSVRTNYFSVNWIMTSNQLKVFEAWYEYKINNGKDWFNLTLKTGTGNNVHSVRFVGRPKIKEISGNWGVSGTVETMSKNLMTEAELDEVLEPDIPPPTDCSNLNQVFSNYEEYEYKKIAIDKSNGTVYACYNRELRRKLPEEEQFCKIGELSSGSFFSGIAVDSTTGDVYTIVFTGSDGRIMVFDEITGSFVQNGDIFPSAYYYAEALCVFEGVLYIGGQNGSPLGCVFSRLITETEWSIFYSGYSEHSGIDGIYCSDIYADNDDTLYITWGFSRTIDNEAIYGGAVTKYYNSIFSDILYHLDDIATGLGLLASRRYNGVTYVVGYELTTEGSWTGMGIYSQSVDGDALSRLPYTVEDISNGWDAYSGYLYSLSAYVLDSDPLIEKSAFISYEL